MVRGYVKWDYELRNFAQLESVLRRAFTIATSEPKGPVYLTLPRELLGEAQRSRISPRAKARPRSPRSHPPGRRSGEPPR
jgi:acetolactate synthase-1/2/3 large subunit